MTVIFLTPLLFSIWAAWYLAFMAEVHGFWRVTAVILVVVAAGLQVIDVCYPGEYIHFLIPLLMQIIVSIGAYILSQLDGVDQIF